MMQAPEPREAAGVLASITVFKNDQANTPEDYRCSRKHLTQAPEVLVANSLGSESRESESD